MNAKDSSELEIKLFLEAMHQIHGYDFTSYARASLHRRILHLTEVMGVQNISSLIPKVIHEEQFIEQAISVLTVSVSELFRDPDVFKELRKKVIAYLKTFPKINIWVAGCAFGEEVYSITILLHEEGLLNRSQIYATDICPIALKQAKSGILKGKLSTDDAKRYQESGGKHSLSDYFTTLHGFSKLQEELLSHTLFQQHNMVNESAFLTPQLLICRNVLIYFNKELQNQVLETFHQCLDDNGFLVIGPKESMSPSSQQAHFKVVDHKTNIYQKKLPNY